VVLAAQIQLGQVVEVLSLLFPPDFFEGHVVIEGQFVAVRKRLVRLYSPARHELLFVATTLFSKTVLELLFPLLELQRIHLSLPL
jgi:hypothetical protein